MFDEPTSALDPSLVGEVLKVVESLAHEGRTMIVVTHEMSFAKEAADRVYFMEEGNFVEIGSSEQVIDNPKEERTRQFLARFLRGAERPRVAAPAADLAPVQLDAVGPGPVAPGPV